MNRELIASLIYQALSKVYFTIRVASRVGHGLPSMMMPATPPLPE
jgi:hypothetical protein